MKIIKKNFLPIDRQTDRSTDRQTGG